ncbi:MAG: hypothetical protein INR71_01880 [Terriglobus roseus]|nr:hypothetical protein [Terriglobus roseus]
MLATVDYEGASLADAVEGSQLLRDWGSGKETWDRYLEAVRARWPEATVFKAS